MMSKSVGFILEVNEQENTFLDIYAISQKPGDLIFRYIRVGFASVWKFIVKCVATMSATSLKICLNPRAINPCLEVNKNLWMRIQKRLCQRVEESGRDERYHDTWRI